MMMMMAAGHRRRICSCPLSTTSCRRWWWWWWWWWLQVREGKSAAVLLVQQAAGDDDDDDGCRSQKEDLQLSSEYNKLQEMMMMMLMMMVAGHRRKICSCPLSTTSCRRWWWWWWWWWLQVTEGKSATVLGVQQAAGVVQTPGGPEGEACQQRGDLAPESDWRPEGCPEKQAGGERYRPGLLLLFSIRLFLIGPLGRSGPGPPAAVCSQSGAGRWDRRCAWVFALALFLCRFSLFSLLVLP